MHIKHTAMIILFMSAAMSIFSCHSSNHTTADKPVVAAPLSDSTADAVPVCIKAMITAFKSEAMSNPPRKIYSYMYNGEKVYYVSAVCCDNFSDLYNDSCKLIGHPDGGFTGHGDGKFRDFNTAKTMEKLLWSDPRGK